MLETTEPYAHMKVVIQGVSGKTATNVLQLSSPMSQLDFTEFESWKESAISLLKEEAGLRTAHIKHIRVLIYTPQKNV